MTRSLSTRAATFAALVLLAACKDSNSPPDPNRIVNVFVGTQVDSATLRDRGEFILTLVPVNGHGSVVTEGITIEPSVTGAAPAITLSGTPRVVPPDARPVAAAVSMDNSRSMLDSDPQRRRVTAAQQFWTALLGADTRSVAALLGFGVDAPSPGFSDTKLFQTWTNDVATLNAAFDGISVSNGSPLYRSSREIVRWIDSTRTPDDAYRRILVVFTDGLPDDPTAEAALMAEAASNGVTIHTVGLGTASDQSTQMLPDAVARLTRLADETGGVYAGAPSAGSLPAVFEALATISSDGALLATVKLDPIPAAGTIVAGKVRVSNVAGGADGNWTVTVK